MKNACAFHLKIVSKHPSSRNTRVSGESGGLRVLLVCCGQHPGGECEHRPPGHQPRPRPLCVLHGPGADPRPPEDVMIVMSDHTHHYHDSDDHYYDSDE